MPAWKDIGVALLFGIWLVLSAIRQIRNPHWLRRFDVFRLVPGWKLFSGLPLPDCRLYFREFRADDLQPEWRCILSPGERTLLSAIWHPQRRMRKWLETAAEKLMHSNVTAAAESWVSRAIRNYLEMVPAESLVLERQFALEVSPEYLQADRPHFVYESPVFPVSASCDRGPFA